MKYVLMFFALSTDGTPSLTAQEFETEQASEVQREFVVNAEQSADDKNRTVAPWWIWCAPKG